MMTARTRRARAALNTRTRTHHAHTHATPPPRARAPTRAPSQQKHTPTTHPRARKGINIGPVHKRDVLRANVMNEKGAKKFAVILAFDVPVSKEARELADEYGVRVFTADIIYHLFDQFRDYMKEIKAREQEAARLEAVFPCVLQIMPTW